MNTDQTIAKIHNALRLVKETEALLRETLDEISKEPKIHFYEIYFGEKDDFGGNEDQPSICIRGIRKPTLEEANDWLKTECSFFGGPVTEIDEVDEDTARACYNMDNVVPVFGVTPPAPIDTNRTRYRFWGMGIGVFCVWARNLEEAESATKETWEANRDLLREHDTFIAAVHGGLEPFPLPR
jgi:hypothetical protein